MVFKSIYSKIKQWAGKKNFVIPELMIPAVFLGIALSFLWSPIKTGISEALHTTASESVDQFNRLIGQALVNGMDINKRLENMQFFSFLYLPLICILCYAALLFLFRKTENYKTESFSFLKTVCFINFPALILALITQHSASFLTWFVPLAPCMVVMVLFYIRFGQKLLSLEMFKWVLFASLSLLFIFLASYWRLVYKDTRYMYNEFWLLAAYVLFAAVLFALSIFFVRRGRETSFHAAFMPLSITPILLSIYFEATNILNQHNIFITNKTNGVHFILAIFILMSVIVYICHAHIFKKKSVKFDAAKWLFPILVLSIAVLSVQPPVQIAANAELFESSNAGSDVIGLLRYGEIPIIENLNVHMLEDDITTILYGILNRDPIGAIYRNHFAYSIYLPLIYLAFYYFLIHLSDRENALLIVLFFPLSGILFGFEYFGLGIFALLAALYMYRKKNISAAIIFGITCAAMCIFRLDLGLMFCAAAIIVLTLAFVFKKQWKPLLKLWVCGAAVGISVLAVFVLLCVVRKIPPILRLKEFLDMMMSVDKWAYSTIGQNSENYLFYLIYLIVPAVMLVSAALVLIRKKVLNLKSSDCMIVVMLAVAHFFNYNRTIVRHNLGETIWYIIFSTATLCIFISWYLLKGRKIHMLSLFLSGIFILQFLVGYPLPSGNTLVRSGINRQGDLSLSAVYEEKIDRVVITDELKQIYMPVKTFFDITLDPDETYFDYTYDTTLYSLVERNKPVYTNQSPSQLNTEFSQLMFIAELEVSKSPLALVQSYAKGWDGVPLNINQYLVAEYLNKNYVPFYQVGNYNIWVRHDEYQERKRRLDEYFKSGEIKNELGDLIELDYIYEETPHIYNMGEIAYAWGMHDSAQPQQVLTSFSNVTVNDPVSFDPQSVDMSNGNYIEMILETDNDATCSLTAFGGSFGELITFNFNIHKGQNRYLIRISGDPLWYSGLIDAITVASETPIDLISLKVLEGDTLIEGGLDNIQEYANKLRKDGDE